MSPIVVRAAVPADYPAVARLTVDAYRADGQLNEASATYAETLADVAARAEAGDLLVAVDRATDGAADDGADGAADGAADRATGGDRVLGSVLYVEPGSRYAELSRAGESEFRMLAVDPAAQGRGVGRTLVQACVDRAAAAGCTAVVICVRDFAMAAQKLYMSLGFARVPELDWSPLPGVSLLALRLEIEPGDRRLEIDEDHRGLV
ncbi:GNAT family N-acetyltransferase [Virgisporangium ochraceum]|uniref:N-acetyltransferase n=1 Tax=Virgisporangium ochraceum TaxID=65505 RepID=A0A8J4EC72_9ACTN|nr:GNAT family N-acetyltransferase [Virgisporangium ochraceum]GIJ70180.1 N-acetyltransferase [Virgisporangium ochraceum]